MSVSLKGEREEDKKGVGKAPSLYVPWKSLQPEGEEFAAMGGGATTVTTCLFVSAL